MFRIGIGYDTHKMVKERPLILGGVIIPFDKGLQGHSDADVLLHAIMDAMLGAAAMGDIGRHFPDTDPSFKGANSLELLKAVKNMVDRASFSVNNIDSVIIAEKPRLAPFIDEMRSNIAKCLQIELGLVNVKATTEEGLGFVGRGEGVSAQAVCLLRINYGK